MGEFLPISSLSAYEYCPYSCFLSFVCGEDKENFYKIEGRILHRKVHQRFKMLRESSVIMTGVYVFSKRKCISGIVDMVIIGFDKVIPVEFKRGKGNRIANTTSTVQLAAQSICLEEMLNCHIDYGYVYYPQTQVKKLIELNEKLRRRIDELIIKVRDLFETRNPPDFLFSNRCVKCGFKNICLPEVSLKLKNKALTI